MGGFRLGQGFPNLGDPTSVSCRGKFAPRSARTLAMQIFISYARDDDVVPPDQIGAKGFVTVLYEQLLYEFQNLGQPRPNLWRDTRAVGRGDQFEPLIEKA